MVQLHQDQDMEKPWDQNHFLGSSELISSVPRVSVLNGSLGLGVAGIVSTQHVAKVPIA